MPSSKAVLTAEIASLKGQCGALEAIIALQNGALDEIGKLIEGGHGGMVAHIVMVLARHGVTVNRNSESPFQ